MAKLKFLFLPLLIAFLQPPDEVHAQFGSPFPAMYPKDVGQLRHINQFFQFHTAPMGFTNIYSENSKYYTEIPGSNLDINSVIYRTHKGKGVLFHFNSLGNVTALHKIIIPVDRPNNIYRLPITAGPGRNAEVVNHTDFLSDAGSEIPFRAKIAFGFSEPKLLSQSADGYTAEQMAELSKLTKEYCQHPNNTYYIALNAYYVGASSLPVDFEYYKSFYRCHLLLYTMPKLPLINVPRVKTLLLNKVNRERMLVLVSGRSLIYRLFSLDFVAWGYAKGHYKPHMGQLGESGLLSVLDSGTTMIRLNTYQFQSLDMETNFFFRHIIINDLWRRNWNIDMVPYLAQVADHSHAILLYPDQYERMHLLMDHFKPKYLPFLEARLLRGPNAVDINNQQIVAFWTTMNEMSPRYKIIFSFFETHGKYTTQMMKDLEDMLLNNDAKMGPGIRYGIMLEISGMSKELQMDQLLQDSRLRWVFLKDDREAVKERNLEKILEWVHMFENKTVMMVLNDNFELVNDLYRFFLRPEPNDTSSKWVDADATTMAPTTLADSETAETTGSTSTAFILDPDTVEPEKDALGNVSTNAKSEGRMQTKRDDSRGMELAGMTLLLVFMLQRVLK